MKSKIVLIVFAITMIVGISSFVVGNIALSNLLSNIAACGLVITFAIGSALMADVVNNEIVKMEKGIGRNSAFLMCSLTGIFIGMASLGIATLFIIAKIKGVDMREMYLSSKSYGLLALSVGTVWYFSFLLFNRGKQLFNDGIFKARNSTIPVRLIGIMLCLLPLSFLYINNLNFFSGSRGEISKVSNGFDTVKSLTGNDFIVSLFSRNNLKQDLFVERVDQTIDLDNGYLSNNEFDVWKTPYGLCLRDRNGISGFRSPLGIWIYTILEVVVSFILIRFGIPTMINRRKASLATVKWWVNKKI